MTEQRHIDPEAVLADLKDFQRRTARWVFERMFADDGPAVRFLVADEVGLGKTHVAKGVIAQVIDHLQASGDQRHDIVYVCSNSAIARQNLRKLVPKGIEPLDDVERLTMLPLAQLNKGRRGSSGINLLAITPGTSLRFGHSTGTFPERCLAYAFLRALWGAGVMIPRARWIFWAGITAGDPDRRLRDKSAGYREAVYRSIDEFGEVLAEVDRARVQHGQSTVRELFDELVDGLAWQRAFPDELWPLRAEMIAELRRVMAIVGIAALQPDLVVLDEFQRFKDLLEPEPSNFAAELAHRLFNYIEPETGRPTRTLLLSATPYRMYTTSDETDADHYQDFLATCSFLFQDDKARLERLQHQFKSLRHALTSTETLGLAETICAEISTELRSVMARTERLAATPDRDGMLTERDAVVSVEPDDLRSYLRLGDLAEAVEQHEPTEYWKAGPYLINFMERYKLKEAIDEAALDGLFADGDHLEPGPGLLNWDDIEAYQQIDPQNGRLRWLLADLEQHRAFELLWIPPSLRYYDTGSVYESPEAASFTKRLIFSGWALVPKVVSSLTSFEAERHAYRDRKHDYTTDYRRRGGQRLAFRTTERAAETRLGEATTERRAAAMTVFALTWPSPTLAELGDPRRSRGTGQSVADVLDDIGRKVTKAIEPLTQRAPSEGAVDQRWYWAAPLLLDEIHHPQAGALLLADGTEWHWEGDRAGDGLRTHLAEARAMVEAGVGALGRPPDDLVEVLAEFALGGPAVCALRAITAATRLGADDDTALSCAAWIGASFRSFFNGPEATGIVVGGRLTEPTGDDGVSRYWRDVVRHAIDGNMQAVLDEHTHVLRDWLGYLTLDTDQQRADASEQIALTLGEALEVRTSSFRVDIPRTCNSHGEISLDEHRMRTRFAVAFGNQSLDGGGEARVESISTAFNSPFWPFVLTSTSVGQEGLDFHLWCHSVVHWNLPSNPVDLEQREGRVHRYKGHAVRRNIAATLNGADQGIPANGDVWESLFTQAAATRANGESEMVPYWVFPRGPAKIQRLVPVLPFSRDATVLPQLRKTLAAYRLAFGQPRQDELVEFLGADRSDADLLLLASRLRIDLTPPETEPADRAR